jgi:hypothetical protein
MNKYHDWYARLPESTKLYLKSQPIWHDQDMWKAGIVSFAFGLIVGLLF